MGPLSVILHSMFVPRCITSFSSASMLNTRFSMVDGILSYAVSHDWLLPICVSTPLAYLSRTYFSFCIH
jgi:hypothetical protein